MMEMPAEIAKALVSFQATMEGLDKDAQGQRSQYSSIGAIMTLVKAAAKDSGLAVTIPVCWAEGPGYHLRPILAHSSGVSWQPEEFAWPLIVDDMTNCQKVGSAVSYGRRYLLQSLLGLAAGIADTEFDEDDEGEINGALDALPPPDPDFNYEKWGNDALVAIAAIDNLKDLMAWDGQHSKTIERAESAAPEIYNHVGAAFVEKEESFNGGKANIQKQ